MNLTGYGWITNGFYKEVISKGDQEGTYWWVRSREMVEGGEDENLAYLTEEIVARIQNEILDEIDELNYFYVHQDQERLIETVQELYALRGYLIDE